MIDLEHLKSLFIQELNTRVKGNEPGSLYDPIRYILDLGGKRLRPLLTLIACDLYDKPIINAMDAALAVEMFHNFTLLHDDIMDAAQLRRGQQTVHEKWDVNTGILSGDAMLIMSYRFFNNYDPIIFYDLNKLFSTTALEVCEGQQYDVDFEKRNDVSIEEYLNMIRLKTSVLVGCALQMGAIVAGASKNQQALIYDYGVNLGLAFQLMDDYLDAFGDPATFGKEVGGDIRENKKTYLYLKSLEHEGSATELREWFGMDFKNMDEALIETKKETVKVFFEESGGAQATLDIIKHYTDAALENIEQLEISNENKAMLRAFSIELMGRVS
ncbi:MAG: polyprenyl synthetase family protein [Nonlabens sp.]